MDPKPQEAGSAGCDPDDFTFARKRSRRVSFAETTAVHVFARDEDFETPPETEHGSEELGLRGSHFDSDDSKGSAHREEDAEDDDDDDDVQEKFIRDMDSSSPGSATGSMTSNDDDNFFGPVSTSFIKSGQLSEAGMSDNDNHDITLDSTAFSLHFKNVVPLDDCSAHSAGSIRTPTGESLPTVSHGFLAFNGLKKQVPQNEISDGKMSGSAGDSSNMSLIVDNPDSYDRYGMMSPTLKALLAEANKSIQRHPPINGSRSSMSGHENHVSAVQISSVEDEVRTYGNPTSATGNKSHSGSNHNDLLPMDTDYDQNNNDILPLCEAGGAATDGSSIKNPRGTFSSRSNGYTNDTPEAVQSSADAMGIQNTYVFSSPCGNSCDIWAASSAQFNQGLSQDQPSEPKHRMDSPVPPMPITPSLVNLNAPEEVHTPQNVLLPSQSPLAGSVSSLRHKRQQLILDPSVASKKRLMHTPDKEEPLSSLKMKLLQHGERISAIKIPKPMIHKSPTITYHVSALSEKDPIPHDFGCAMDTKNDGYSAKLTSVPVSTMEYFKNVSEEARPHNTGLQPNYSESKESANLLTSSAKIELGGNVGKLPECFPAVQLSSSKTNGRVNLLTLGCPVEQAAVLDVSNSSPVHITQSRSCEKLDMVHCSATSPIRVYGFELSASCRGCFSPRVDGTSRSRYMLEKNSIQNSKSTSPNAEEPSELHNPLMLEKHDSSIYKLQKTIEGPMHNLDHGPVTMANLVNMKDILSVQDTNPCKEPPLGGFSKLHVSRKMSAEELVSEGTMQSPNKLDGVSNMLHSMSPKELLPSRSGTGNLLLGDESHVHESDRIQKSPKLLLNVGSNSRPSSGHIVECGGESMNIGVQSPQRHWTEIFFKVSEATKKTFSPSACKLTSAKMDIFENILAEMKTARKYERLYTSLTKQTCIAEPDQKRAAEAGALLDKLVYEKAKLQLKQLKLDNLSNKLRLCKSKIQECSKLRLGCSQFPLPDARIIQNQDCHSHSNLNNSHMKLQAEESRVTSLRQELEILEQKVKRLTRGFETSCKIKGNTSCDKIIKVVNDHIERKGRCSFIQQDLQLWKLTDVNAKNGQCDIIIDYSNVLCKRFTVHSRSASRMVVSDLFANEGIEKNFPNMKAAIAFEYVLKAKGGHRTASVNQLSQEIMETNLLLGVLLDVLEEVLVSRMRLWNLISSFFSLHYSGQLELQLCFICFKSGRKVTVCLDLSCLNCAAYPCKASDLQVRITQAEATPPPQMSNNLMGVVGRLDDGRSMIARFCGSISKVVQYSDGL